MHHALSAVVMIVSGLLFTSCTATVVQRWAMSRQVPTTTPDFAAPASFPGEKRQALLPVSATAAAAASAGEECKPEQATDPRGGTVMPRFSPVRKLGPKN